MRAWSVCNIRFLLCCTAPRHFQHIFHEDQQITATWEKTSVGSADKQLRSYVCAAGLQWSCMVYNQGVCVWVGEGGGRLPGPGSRLRSTLLLLAERTALQAHMTPPPTHTHSHIHHPLPHNLQRSENFFSIVSSNDGKAAFLIERAAKNQLHLLRWDGIRLTAKALPGWYQAGVTASSSNWAVAAGMVLQDARYVLKSYAYTNGWVALPDVAVTPATQGNQIMQPSITWLVAQGTNLKSAVVGVQGLNLTIHTLG